jgi:cytochrome c-type biogenesis protein CcmH
MDSIRCLVCQGESIADSPAEMAGDMRSLVRERIQAGESPESIRTWLISRYGDQISLQPPFDWQNISLFVLPVLLLVGGFFLARGRFRRRKRA